MKKIRWKIILSLFLIGWLTGLIFEFLGWKIAGFYDEQIVFPGLANIEILLGGLKTAVGGFIVGFIFLLFMIAFPKFRNALPGNIHIPLIAGVVFLYIIIGITTTSGLVSF